MRLAPTVGTQVGRAVALAECGDLTAGLAALEAIAADRTANYQP